MKIQPNQHISKSHTVSFNGMAISLPSRKIKCATDAIAQWDILKHPQFTNVFQDTENATLREIQKNKQIREHNYKFLDELTVDKERAKFIDYFKRLTGFPNIKDSTRLMLEEFKRVLNAACNCNYSRLLLSGYDKYCSVGLQSALPGSDIDKGYAIVKGTEYGSIAGEKEISNSVKSYIWNNLDNRIMSVNHHAAFPNIMTNKELDLTLDKFDNTAQSFVNENNINYFRNLRMENGNPISGSKFNIWLGERLNSKSDKFDAKNFAYVIEAIRDGIHDIKDLGYWEKLVSKMNNSIFSWCSNVTQSYVMQKKYDYSDVVKPKLKARQDLEKHFNSWCIAKQYDLVKDVIRSMSGDNKDKRFEQFFASKPDRHRLLINDILKGDVDCAFDYIGNGMERTHLFFNTPESMQRYHDLNVYKTDY